MPGPTSAAQLPMQLPNTSQPIAEIDTPVQGLLDSQGKPVTGQLRVSAIVTQAWRYLFGTFVQRSSSVPPTFTLTAGAAYSQTDTQTLIDQVEALSKAVGK
jgi:hypothetical protein